MFAVWITRAVVINALAIVLSIQDQIVKHVRKYDKFDL